MPYCLNFSMGLLGPQSAFFALRTALNILRSNPSPEQTWVKTNHRKLAERYVPRNQGWTGLSKTLHHLVQHYSSNLMRFLSNTSQYHSIYEFFLATYNELSTGRPLHIRRPRRFRIRHSRIGCLPLPIPSPRPLCQTVCLSSLSHCNQHLHASRLYKAISYQRI